MNVLRDVLPSRECCLYTPYYCEENVWKLCKIIDKSMKTDYTASVAISSNENKKSDQNYLDDFKYFRVFRSSNYLDNFLSDRRHMKNDVGGYIPSPPAWQLIFNDESNAGKPLRLFCVDQIDRNLVALAHPQAIADANFKLVSSFADVLYAGFDPTCSSLHIGNLSILSSLLRSIKFGCRVIVIIGSSTACIGDPSERKVGNGSLFQLIIPSCGISTVSVKHGQTSTLPDRDEMAASVVSQNAAMLRAQVESIYSNFNVMYPGSKYKLVLLDNKEWFSKLTLAEFMDICRLFRVGEMLRTGAVKSRFHSGEGIRCSEFLYQVFQSYDWNVLRDRYDCCFQIGGSDQFGHLIIGSDYIMRRSGKNSAGICLPLLTDSNGNKLGKSIQTASENIWLSSERTSPYSFYQFFRQQPDKEIIPLIRQLSLRPLQHIDAVIEDHLKNLGKWIAQKELATELTRLIHGEKGLQVAEQCSQALFRETLDELENLTGAEIEQLFGKASVFHISRSSVRTFGELADRIRTDKNLGSNLLKFGALKLNGKKYLNPDEKINFTKIMFHDKGLTIANCAVVAYSELQREILRLYMQFLRHAVCSGSDALRHNVRQVYRTNATKIRKSDTMLIEYHLRRGKRQLESLKSTSVTGFSVAKRLSDK